MFLEALRQRNPELALAAVRYHQDQVIAPNTYLFDLDTIGQNAAGFHEAASSLGLSEYFMAKQYGRNPDVSRAAIAAGMAKAVAVDLQCMAAHGRHGIPVGHVGHLVQPARGSEHAVVAATPEVVTVFDVDCARRIGAAARAGERTQDVLLRVRGPGDTFYFGHAGGFLLSDVESAADAVKAVEGVRVVGVTTFPCLLGDPGTKKVEPTHNLGTLVEAAERLRKAGHAVEQVNAPGTNSTSTLELLARVGATHVEPGNALHGTTPATVFDPDAGEVPAVVYLSEVGHFVGDDAYAFAAGYYVDKVLGGYPLRALVGRDGSALDRALGVQVAPDGAIHYYFVLPDARKSGVEVGDSVVLCFRPQVFVTRGRTQAIAGLHGAAVTVLDRYDGEAHKEDLLG
jgi:predicted amino acid racemase